MLYPHHHEDWKEYKEMISSYSFSMNYSSLCMLLFFPYSLTLWTQNWAVKAAIKDFIPPKAPEQGYSEAWDKYTNEEGKTLAEDGFQTRAAMQVSRLKVPTHTVRKPDQEGLGSHCSVRNN